MKNITIGLNIQNGVLDQFDKDLFRYDQDQLFVFFLKKSVKEIIANHSSNLDFTKELSWCESELQNCTMYLVFAYNLVYFPFEVIKYRDKAQGFGTFLAYFSKLLHSKDQEQEPFSTLDLSPEETKVRNCMAEVLLRLSNQSELSKLTPYDLVQLVHRNVDDKDDIFARPIQFDFGCRNSYAKQFDEIVKYYKQSWEDWSSDEVKEIPCSNQTSKTYPCCKVGRTVLKPELIPTLLKVMKYAVQPVRYFDKDIKEIFGDLSFLEYGTFVQDEKFQLMAQTNKNSRIPMCKYAGNPKEFDPKKCQLFHVSFTDEGIGYTFNGVNFWNSFQHFNYSRKFATIMQPKGYTNLQKDENVYRDVKNPLSSGPAFGVEAFIEKHVIFNQLKYGQPKPIKVSIHDPISLASMTTSSIEVKLGYSTTFLISAQQIQATDDTRSIPIKERQCEFQNEAFHSKLFATYTQNNCRYECKMRKAIEKCQCIPWDFPQFKDQFHPICDRFARDCFLTKMKDTESLVNCSCPNDCETTIYSYSVSSNPNDPDLLCKDEKIRGYILNQYGQFFIKQYEEMFYNRNVTVKAWDLCVEKVQNFAIVKFQMAHQHLTKINLKLRVTFADIISNIGNINVSIRSIFL